MTIMAGLFSRVTGERPPQHLCRELKGLLSRHPADKPVEFADGRLWMAKIDIGAFASPGLYTDEAGACSLLTGEPLLDDGPADRYADLKRLHGEWIRGDLGATARTRGAFCAACYAPAKQQLRLVTDRLGLRGLYLMVCDRFVLFASAFRIIEALASVSKNLDLVGLAERCTFGLPLGDSTDFLEVKRLRPAETVVIEGNSVRRSRYWSWDAVEPSSGAGLVERLYHSFMTAISLRLKDDRAVSAFLSGGLDSRAVVAGLARRGVSVHSINLSSPQTQDGALGRQFAKALRTHHVEFELGASSRAAWWQSAAAGAAALRKATALSSAPPDRPALIWNGEGGSCGFGHIHLTQAIVDLAREGDRGRFFSEFAAYNYWSTVWQRVLRRPWSAELGARVAQRFRSEMDRAAPADPGRLPYFFLLFNDQGHKLDALQANADLIRAEMLTPFFDIEFLSIVAAANIDLFIGHKLYVEWLGLFQPQVLSVPWQSYPGHIPSPEPVPIGLEYQWERRTRSTPDERRFARSMLRRVLQPSTVPGWLVRRGLAAAAAALTMTGVENYSYLLGCVETFSTAWGYSRKVRAGAKSGPA